MHPDFQLPEPADAHDEKLLADVAEHGWHVVHIPEDKQGPAYAFTIGLYLKYQHPELLVMGLPQEVAHRLLTMAVAQIAQGRVFQTEQAQPDLAEGLTCRFRPISLKRYREYLGYGIWFYRSLPEPFPALQLVWPDRAGRFPGEAEFDPKFTYAQVMLDTD